MPLTTTPFHAAHHATRGIERQTSFFSRLFLISPNTLRHVSVAMLREKNRRTFALQAPRARAPLATITSCHHATPFFNSLLPRLRRHAIAQLVTDAIRFSPPAIARYSGEQTPPRHISATLPARLWLSRQLTRQLLQSHSCHVTSAMLLLLTCRCELFDIIRQKRRQPSRTEAQQQNTRCISPVALHAPSPLPAAMLRHTADPIPRDRDL